MRHFAVYNNEFKGYFTVVQDPNENEEGSNFWRVEKGSIFRGFSHSLDEKNTIEIEGLDESIDWGENMAIYIELHISPALQVTKAVLKCTEIGGGPSEGDSVPETWEDFPEMFKIAPRDEISETGRITRRAEGARQVAAYLLIALRSDHDISEYAGGKIGKSESGESEPEDSESFEVRQVCNTNVIMMISQHRGIPVLFPMPWFGSIEGPVPVEENEKKSAEEN